MKYFFEVLWARVVIEMDGDHDVSLAAIKVKVNDRIEIEAGEGDGPIEALDQALRKVLWPVFPELAKVKLTGFDVKNSENIREAGAGAMVRAEVRLKYNGCELVFTGRESKNMVRSGFSALEEGYNVCLRKLADAEEGDGKL